MEVIFLLIDVEKIRNLCKQKGTSLTKVEKTLGFSNGSIGKWAKSQSGPPYEKILKVAQLLKVTVNDLESDQKEKPTPVSESELPLDVLEMAKAIYSLPLELREQLRDKVAAAQELAKDIH